MKATAGRPVVALLTDFGLHDHYVGAMKGAVLSVCGDASLVDITHEIAPQDIAAAAYELHAAYSVFPRGTVFLVVVDPGVGSARRAIAAEAHGYYFVGPDNGVLTHVVREPASSAVVALTNPEYARPTISRTFEGRDRFAPAAGWIACGTRLDALGPRITDWVTLPRPEPEVSGDAVRGEVVRVDRFGNAITNIDVTTLARVGPVTQVHIGTHRLPLVGTYTDVAAADPCALIGSSGRLEIAVNGGSAAAQLHLARGAAVVASRQQDQK